MLNINQLLEAVASLSQAVNQAISLLSEYKDENTALQSQVTNLQDTIATKDATIAALQEEIEKLNIEPSEATQVIQQAQSDVDTVTSELLNIAVTLNTAVQ